MRAGSRERAGGGAESSGWQGGGGKAVMARRWMMDRLSVSGRSRERTLGLGLADVRVRVSGR